VAANNWKAFARIHQFREVDEYGENDAIETWSYDPAGLSDKPVVDPLSLYTQFWDHRDERISMAAETLLEKLKWS
jgi:hypothetical protein